MEDTTRKRKGEFPNSSLPEAKRRETDNNEGKESTNDETTSLHINDLTPELLMEIILLIPLKELPTICLTCQEWRRLADSTWRSRYLKRWPCDNVAVLQELLPFVPILQSPEPWTCPACTLINAAHRTKCEVCEGPKPDPVEEKKEDEDPKQKELSEGQRWKNLYHDRHEIELNDQPSVLDRAYTYWVEQDGIEGLLKIHACPGSCIRRVSYLIQDLTGIPPEAQELTHGDEWGNPVILNSVMRPSKQQLDMIPIYHPVAYPKTLLSYNIVNRSKIHLRLKPAALSLWKGIEEKSTAPRFAPQEMEKEKLEFQRKKNECKSGMTARLAKYTNSPTGVAVKTLTGRTYLIPIGEDCCIIDLMARIQDYEGIPVDQQRIIWCGSEISKCEYETLGFFGVSVGDLKGGNPPPSILHLVLRLRGD